MPGSMRGTAVSNGKIAAAHGLTRDHLLRAYRTMVLSRKIDDKEIQLKNQSLIFFQISGAGHEAVLVAAGMHLRPGHDWFYPVLPRPRALPHARRHPARHADERGRRRRTIRARADGRCPRTGAIPRLNIVSQSSPTGTQCLQAIGAAEAGRLYERVTDIEDREARFHHDEVTYLSVGEGTTSEGEFWESLNAACLGAAPHRLPRRGQRLRHLGPCRSADRRRRHLQARRPRSPASSCRASTARTSSQATARCRKRSPTRGRARDRRSSTRASSARTRIRCQTTSGCTRRRTSGAPRRSAIRSCAWPRS